MSAELTGFTARCPGCGGVSVWPVVGTFELAGFELDLSSWWKAFQRHHAKCPGHRGHADVVVHYRRVLVQQVFDHHYEIGFANLGDM